MKSIVTFLALAIAAPLLLSTSAPHVRAAERVTYKRNPDRDVTMTITKPHGWSAGDRRAAIIFFYNGGWKEPGATKPQFEAQTQYFAARGMVVGQADYREKSRDGVTSAKCVEDIFSAVRWLRRHAEEWGIDPARIAAAGGSGSIHLPAVAFQTDDILAPGEDATIPPLPGALFCFNPDPDVLESEMMLRLLSGGPRDGSAAMPPTVIYWGSRDAAAPYLAEFVEKTHAAGLPIEKFVGERGVHGFFKFTPGLEQTTAHMDARLRALGFLANEPSAELPRKSAPADYEERILATQQRWLDQHHQLAQTRHDLMARPEPQAQPAAPVPADNLSASGAKDRTAADQTQRLAAMLKRFPEADTNKDGVLTMEEAQAHRENMRRPKAPLAAQPQAATAKIGPDAAPSKSWDTNGDGRISREEFKGPAQLFQNMDTDGDGFLSGAELTKLDQKLRLDKIGEANWVVPPTTKFTGVEHHTYFSRAMQTDVGYNIYLPEGYAVSPQRYPVIYHLHGSGGNESSQIDLAGVYHPAITEGRMCPVILVFANGGKRSYYSDGTNGKIRAETTIIRELIPHIDASYRTIPEKACRVIHGFSMGGYGALKFGAKFPETFCAALSFGGGMASPGSLHLDFLQQIVGADERAIAANNPADLVRQNKAALAGMSWWLFTGTRDVAREDSTWAHQHLDQLGIPHRFEVSEDVGHTLKRHYGLFGEDIFKMLQSHFVKSAAFSNQARQGKSNQSNGVP